ncbi:MAG: glycosyltransferase family 2 protein [Endomicrobiales bacterium]|nr:glycosyltransferase family 2 protein [Endomicrobiales bacterium]
MEKKKLSVYILSYNNENKIRDCLESVKWADEIVVLDSFSTDKTVDICKEYTKNIIQEKFAGFGRLRNIALSHTSNDWILSVDTDERVTVELKNEIEEMLKGEIKADAYYVPRISHFLNHQIKHCGWYPDYRQPQFFNKNKMKYTSQLVHETFELNGKIGYLKGHMLQFPFFTLDELFSKMDRYSSLRAREMTEQGKKFNISQLLIHPVGTFLRMYVQKAGFLDGREGFILSVLYSYYVLVKYVKLWEKTRK